MGPSYGPMSGEEMVYIVLKGRILKNDLTITVRESTDRWTSQVDNFTKNGNVVYFAMPACPFADSDRVMADILIYYKQGELFQSRYMYKGSLDGTLVFAATSLIFTSHPLLCRRTCRTSVEWFFADNWITSIILATSFKPVELLFGHEYMPEVQFSSSLDGQTSKAVEQ